MENKEIRLGHITLPTNVLMAPLVGYTCYPFRMMCGELGAGLCFTEMVSCNALKYKDRATQRLLLTTPEEKYKAAQLLGSDPGLMEQMAKSEIFSDYDIIDINMGCPVPNVFKSGEGSALLGDFKQASACIKGCKRSGKTVTVKCRIGIKENDLFAAEFARVCEDAGADMISIHGRSRSMMYDGTPYYDQIEQAKSAVSIPVIANGGINSVADADEVMRRTGADGVMIARYGLENPYIFSELTQKDVRQDKYALLCRQIELTARYYDETFTIQYIRKLAAYFMRKRKGTKQYKAELFRCGDIAGLREVIRKIFCEEEDGNQ